MEHNVFRDKYYVFLISGGRTGTKFFGNLLQKIIEDTFSVHEPDVLELKKGLQDILYKIKIFGFYHMIIGRIFNKTGIRNLSQNFLAGKITLKALNDKIIGHRKKYYDKIHNDLIIESYYGWYGCIPAIQNLYKNYKIVVITRDPCDWVTSNMNWEAFFGKRDWVDKFNLGRLNPKMVSDQKYNRLWGNFTRLQKVAWTYKYQYETMIENVKNDENALVMKFEDLFYSKDRLENLRCLLDFITKFQDKSFQYVNPANILNKQINKNISYEFPNYTKWDPQTKKQFKEICLPVMEKLNYREKK